MAKEQFVEKRTSASSVHVITQANAILREYAAQGFTMTLRQLHYQFVARHCTVIEDGEAIPYANTLKSYKRLGNIMSEARLAGLVDWDHMEDRVRELDRQPRWDSPATILEAVAQQYKEDLWKGQKVRPEVWIEKDALAGVVERICRELRVDFFACRGYVSQSAQYEASKRFLRYLDQGQEPIVFHFGDHDPSGIDMTRENAEKFRLLTGTRIQVRRLALNYDQVEEYNPPPNPAKLTDSRANGYVEEFGTDSWELDALEPQVIESLIRDNITPLIDQRKWREADHEEQRNRSLLERCSDRWADVEEFLTRR